MEKAATPAAPKPRRRRRAAQHQPAHDAQAMHEAKTLADRCGAIARQARAVVRSLATAIKNRHAIDGRVALIAADVQGVEAQLATKKGSRKRALPPSGAGVPTASKRARPAPAGNRAPTNGAGASGDDANAGLVSGAGADGLISAPSNGPSNAAGADGLNSGASNGPSNGDANPGASGDDAAPGAGAGSAGDAGDSGDDANTGASGDDAAPTSGDDANDGASDDGAPPVSGDDA
jgi:hypothetical protein